MRRWPWLFSLLLLGGEFAAAQTPVRIQLDDPGVGTGPRLLARALATPYVVIGPASSPAVLPKDSTYRQTVIVLGRETVLDGTVDGDLIVIAGDLHVHPRSVVRGHVTVIGGGLYESTVARVGSSATFSEFTYDITPIAGGYALRYRPLNDRPFVMLSWPAIYGWRLPSYDRTNGLSTPFGPLFTPSQRLAFEPRVTYRSNLGKVDPAGALEYAFNSRAHVTVSGEHGTFSNDDWIWPDYLNSASTLFAGHDTRNYFRATRAQAVLSYRFSADSDGPAPYLGGRWERAYSVGPDSFATGGPWSFAGRRDRTDMLRPNPPIDSGTIASGILGGRIEREDGPVSGFAQLDFEAGGFSPRFGSTRGFAQLTFDGSIVFPTFGLQTLRFDGHLVTSFTNRTPRQRWVYVGGTGTIPTIDLLERGGDQLIFVDARYTIPLTRISLPLVGPPTLTIREVLGGADVQRFPDIAQATGLRIGVSVFYVQFMFDPVHRDRGQLGVGISLAR